MKSIGLFEAKTKLSEICERVSRTGESVVVTRRGEPLVHIVPVRRDEGSIVARRAAYMAAHGHEEPDDPRDFEPAARSRDESDFRLNG